MPLKVLTISTISSEEGKFLSIEVWDLEIINLFQLLFLLICQPLESCASVVGPT